MHLFLIRTPFQAYLCAKIIAQEGIRDYDVIYISRNPNNKDEHYFQTLEPRQGAFFKYLISRDRWTGYAKAARAFPWWALTTRYSHVYLANFSLWYFRTIIGWQRQAKVCTYDEGSTNYIDKAERLLAFASPRDRMISTALGGRSVEWFARNAWRHYAVNANLPNILDPAKVVGIQTNVSFSEAAKGPPLTVLIGQPFRKYLTAEQEGHVLDYMRAVGGLYFLHPMEQDAPPGVTPVESDLIIEDFVEHKLDHHRRVDLVGAWSTALMTINLPCVRKLYLDADGAADRREIMLRVGCEVVNLDARCKAGAVSAPSHGDSDSPHQCGAGRAGSRTC